MKDAQKLMTKKKVKMAFLYLMGISQKARLDNEILRPFYSCILLYSFSYMVIGIHNYGLMTIKKIIERFYMHPQL